MKSSRAHRRSTILPFLAILAFVAGWILCAIMVVPIVAQEIEEIGPVALPDVAEGDCPDEVPPGPGRPVTCCQAFTPCCAECEAEKKQFCYGPWPNAEAWHRKVYGHSDDVPPFAPWRESPCIPSDPDFIPPPPPEFLRYSLSADALVLSRDAPDFDNFLSVAPATFTNFEDVNNAVAPRISLVIPIYDSNRDWELNFFGTDGFSARRDYTLAPLGDGQLQFGSQIYSTELNFRVHPRDWLTVYWGVRCIELEEDLEFQTLGAVSTVLHSYDTNNYLYGLQLGTEIGLFQVAERFWIDGTAKGGIYANHADATRFEFEDGVSTNVRDRHDEATFAGELGITCKFQLTDYWTLRAGYQAMMLDNVALVFDSLLVDEPTSNLLLHGGFAGLELHW
ncbi:MAG: hypothetical protein SGJ20_04650 [Planctomycetota bacterium]|nr:hypothetical protein [Planctomycetota bacterium]